MRSRKKLDTKDCLRIRALQGAGLFSSEQPSSVAARAVTGLGSGPNGLPTA